MDKTDWIKKNCKFAQSRQSYDDYQEHERWIQQQIAPYEARIEDDPENMGDAYLLDGGSKYKILRGEDRLNNVPKWDLLEFDGTEWGLTDEDYELSDLISRIDSVGQESNAPGLPSAPNTPQVDPATRMYDLHGKGAKMSPEEASEYNNLTNQHKQQTGKLPGYMAWTLKNCKFAQGIPPVDPVGPAPTPAPVPAPAPKPSDPTSEYRERRRLQQQKEEQQKAQWVAQNQHGPMAAPSKGRLDTREIEIEPEQDPRYHGAQGEQTYLADGEPYPVTVKVEYDAEWNKGSRGSFEEPPEAAGWIIGIHRIITKDGRDITAFWSESDLSYLEERLASEDPPIRGYEDDDKRDYDRMATWVRGNCKFAQTENLGGAPLPAKELADQAWMYLGEEEQYQHDRMMIHGKKTDQWFEDDKNALIQAESTGNIPELQRIMAKYKQIDEQARQQPQGPPQ